MDLKGIVQRHFGLYCFLFLLGSPQLLVGQMVIKGVVTDADTGLPLPYVNIGFIDKGLGTVSEENGEFNFNFDPQHLAASDTLKVSSLAYRPHMLSFAEIQQLAAHPFEVKLEPEVVRLREVVLTQRKTKNNNRTEKMVGYPYVGQLKNGSWHGAGALGGELVTKINVNRKKRQLNAFYFHVLENTSDSLLIRINVYDGTSMYPEKKLTPKNIVYTLKTKVGKVGIDLAPYEITVQDDFSIGIELLKVYGEHIGLVLAGDDTPGVSYRRYISQGSWKRYGKDALTYYVGTTLLEEGEMEESAEETFVTGYSNEQLLYASSDSVDQVSGFVFREGEPIKGAQVTNRNTGEVVSTEGNGRYALKAAIDDTLEFSHPALETQERKVLEGSFAINVSLEEKIVDLQEVTVTGTVAKRRTQKELFEHYGQDKGIIRTSFGFFDKQTSGVSLKILDVSGFSNGATTLGNLLRGKVSGLTMPPYDNADGSTVVYLRQQGTLNPIPAAFEVDGLIVSGFPSFLEVAQIERIAVLSGLSAVAKYGTVGAGGVIIINTKGSTVSPVGSTKKNPYPQEKNDHTISEAQARRNWPDFLKALYAAQNVSEAKNIYRANEPKYGSNPNFNIDASVYFLEFWPNETFTEALVFENLSRFPNDVNYLKALAFVLDIHGKYPQSVELYKHILRARSNAVQSYRDLANAYLKNRQEQRGKNMYARYFNLLKEGYFSKQPEAIVEVINSEVRNLLTLPEEAINTPLPDFTNKKDDKTRILLEWNDDAAELDFQFVGPDKNVSNWTNAMDGTSKENLISKGYTSKDFFIYGNPRSWEINANYKGNETGLATYLKITVSTAYGTENQTDRVALYRMDIKNVNRALMEL